MTSVQSSTRLPCGNRVLDLALTHVMGILNVTPDSFSDGGQYSQLDAALRHAEAMVAAGATLIDVGGESTRPGARAVSPLEELERVAPIVERIQPRTGCDYLGRHLHASRHARNRTAWCGVDQ